MLFVSFIKLWEMPVDAIRLQLHCKLHCNKRIYKGSLQAHSVLVHLLHVSYIIHGITPRNICTSLDMFSCFHSNHSCISWGLVSPLHWLMCLSSLKCHDYNQGVSNIQVSCLWAMMRSEISALSHCLCFPCISCRYPFVAHVSKALGFELHHEE